MPILNYNNRKKFKSKAAIELEFHKSTNYKLPPGYHSFDICLVGGGAGGICGTPLYVGGTTTGNNSSYRCPGGNGGYVLNLYNKKFDTNDIYVNIGNGGYCNVGDMPVSFYTTKKDSSGRNKFDSFIFKTIGNGGITYLKDNKTNTILYEAPGAGGWMYNYFTSNKSKIDPVLYRNILRMGGGNFGGEDSIFNGRINGLPITRIYNSLYMEYIVNSGSSSKDEHRTVRYLAALPNQSISLEGYGETKIFGGKGVAGGGCASDFYTDRGTPYLYGKGPLGPGSYSTSYENPDGGGDSGIVYNNDGNIAINRYSGSGKPNTGGGGAGGIYIVYNSNDRWYVRVISGPGSGGSGLLVLRCYPDEKRPDIRFVDGINRYIIE